MNSRSVSPAATAAGSAGVGGLVGAALADPT